MNNVQKLVEAAQAIAEVSDRQEPTIPVFTLAGALDQARDKFPHDAIIANMAESYKTLQKDNQFRMVNKDHIQSCFNHFAGLGCHDNIRSILGEMLVDHRVGLSTNSNSIDRSWGDCGTRNIEDVQNDKQPLEIQARALEVDLAQEAKIADQGFLSHTADLILRSDSRFSNSQINSTLQLVANEFKQVAAQSPSVRFVQDSEDGIRVIATLNNGKTEKDFQVDVVFTSTGAPMPIHSYSFDEGKTSRLFIASNLSADLNGDRDGDRLVVSEDLIGINFNQLMHQMYLASLDHDSSRCREVLAVVQEKYPEQVALAVNEYIDGTTTNKESKATCSRLMRNKTSVQDLCGHLLIPVTQVVVDAQGHCRRKSLAAFDSSSAAGVSISTSKVSLT